MSKKRGFSLEEKSQAMIGIFHESADVFVLKDIEKLAPKRGVVLQAVKEVLQGLVDEDLVHCEKIGISNYFWSFPSEASAKLNTDVSRLEAHLAAKNAEAEAAKKALDDAAAAAAGDGGDAASAERAAALQLMTTKEARVAGLHKTLAQYANSDPSKLEAVAEAAELAKDAANRWLDNCFALRSWMEAKFEGRGEEVRAFFEQAGLKEDADYL